MEAIEITDAQFVAQLLLPDNVGWLARHAIVMGDADLTQVHRRVEIAVAWMHVERYGLCVPVGGHTCVEVIGLLRGYGLQGLDWFDQHFKTKYGHLLAERAVRHGWASEDDGLVSLTDAGRSIVALLAAPKDEGACPRCGVEADGCEFCDNCVEAERRERLYLKLGLIIRACTLNPGYEWPRVD